MKHNVPSPVVPAPVVPSSLAALLLIALTAALPETASAAAKVVGAPVAQSPMASAADIPPDTPIVILEVESSESAGPAALPLRPTTPALALLDFQSTTLEADPVRALSQAMWARLAQHNGLRLLPRPATRRWLIQHDLHPFMPYEPSPSLLRVARALRVQYLVTGHIDYIDEMYLLDISVTSARDGRPILKEIKVREGELDRGLFLMQTLSDEVVRAIERDLTQRLQAVAVKSNLPHNSRPPRIKRSLGASKIQLGGGAVIESVEKEPEPMLDREEVAEPPTPTTPSSQPVATTEPPSESDAQPTPLTTVAQSEPPPTPQPTAEPTAPQPTVKPTPQPIPTPPSAKELYQAARELDPDGPEYLEKLEQAVQAAPDQPVYRYQLSTAYYGRDRFADCVVECQRALELKPGNSMLLTIMGSAYFELDQWAESLKANEAALEADPKNYYALYNRALTLTAQESTQALGAWKDYIKRSAEDATQTQLRELAQSQIAQLEGTH